MLDRLNSVFTGSTTAPRKSPADMYLHLLLQAGTQLLKNTWPWERHYWVPYFSHTEPIILISSSRIQRPFHTKSSHQTRSSTDAAWIFFLELLKSALRMSRWLSVPTCQHACFRQRHLWSLRPLSSRSCYHKNLVLPGLGPGSNGR